MNKMKIGNFILCLLVISASFSSAEPNCDSLRNQEILLRKNIKKDLFILASTSGVALVLIGITEPMRSGFNNKLAATWGIAIGIPTGVFIVTVVDVTKKIRFRIENRNKCKNNETQ